MVRLSREVRFAVNDTPADTPDPQLATRPTNSFGGYPSLAGLGHWFALQVTVAGELDPATSYLLNIKDIDTAVRARVVPLVAGHVARRTFGGGGRVVREVFDTLRDAWPAAVALDCVTLALTPLMSLSIRASEHPMVRLSQSFEFSASHRLHNPALGDEENRRSFGKCNNPHGHGHNYQLQVTLAGDPDPRTGLIVDVPAFERVVDEAVIQRVDHKNLNVELPEFRDLIPSVENIAKVIYRLLKPKFETHGSRARLASVTVWETPKTWCEYAE